jgi:hypothetical protein
MGILKLLHLGEGIVCIWLPHVIYVEVVAVVAVVVEQVGEV